MADVAVVRKGLGAGIILTAAIAAFGWALSVESRLSTSPPALQRVERAERDVEATRDYLRSIDQRLARIEGKLERKSAFGN